MKLRINKSAIFVLKKLVVNNIAVLSVMPVSLSECELEINKKDEIKVKKIFKIKFIRRPKKHLYVVACVFLFVFFMLSAFAQSFVFKVVINAKSDEVKQHVLNLISTSFFPKSRLDKVKLQDAIMQNERVTLCSVNFVGLTLVVNIKEAEEIKFDESSNIISTVEGIVESVNVVSGTANVKKGDYVRVGDCLIKAEVNIGGIINNTPAIGQVGILAYVQVSEVFAENREEVLRTGKAVTEKHFTFFRHADIMKTREIPFKFYEIETIKQSVKIGGLLPMKKTEFKIFELTSHKVFESFEENKTQILGTALEKAKIKAGIEKAFYSENTNVKELFAGVYEIVATVQFLIYIN